MIKRASLGIKIAGIVGVAVIVLLGFKYLKWILVLLGLKLLLEVFWKGYKNRKPSNFRFNPAELVEKMRLGAVRGGERFAEGVEVPRPSMSKIMMFAIGGLVLLVFGVVIFKALSGLFKLLKPLLILGVILLVFLLVAKAKRGRPVTMSKVARHARNFSKKKAPDMEGYQNIQGYDMGDMYGDDYREPYSNRRETYRDPYREPYRESYRDQYREPRNNCKYGRDCREYDECRGEYECIYNRRPQRDNRERVSRNERDRRTERMHVGR